MKQGIELIEKLALCFGPTSCEGEVENAIREELAGLPVELATDRMGNLTAHLPGPAGAPRIMLSAHMDEVGFMITDIEEDGSLRFGNLGGYDHAVLAGRFVWLGDEQKRIPGVIAAKGIHQMDAKDRKKLPEFEDLYIDIGTSSREESEKLIRRGDFAAFDTPFARFGKDGAYIRCKALDDRMGCAILIEVLRTVKDLALPLDLWFCFTVREEIGRSGAKVTANRVAPDAAIVLETTAIADLPDVDAARRVADVGKGGVLSLLDRSTIYDRDLIAFALDTAKANDIPVQVKRYVSGGNDAAHIQRSGIGVRCLALSAATRYLHAPVSVASIQDYESMIALVTAMLRDWKEEK
ncbi:MAG: M42 family metallopeptidase [Clostridia bacterium]|nr:M42 family metallopeptidase [Clostridia bacterium]